MCLVTSGEEDYVFIIPDFESDFEGQYTQWLNPPDDTNCLCTDASLDYFSVSLIAREFDILNGNVLNLAKNVEKSRF